MRALGRTTRVSILLFLVMAPVFTVGCSATSGRMMNRIGMRNYKKGNYAAARDNFARAVADDPYHPDYRHNLASSLQKIGDDATAERVLRHNLSIAPMHQPTYHTLAANLVKQQRTTEAYDLLTEWTATQPYVPESHIEMAWLHKEMNNTVAAEASLRQALKAQPNNPVALAHLGEVYHKTGRGDVAEAYYKRSLTSRWDQPEVKSRLSTVASRRDARRSAMAMNSDLDVPEMTADVSSLVDQPFVTADGTVIPASAIGMTPESTEGLSRREVRRARSKGSDKITAYPLPNYDETSVWGPTSVASFDMNMTGYPVIGQQVMAQPAMAFQPPVVTQYAPVTEQVGLSPIPITAEQPVLQAPNIATGTMIAPQADPAHATETVAELPVVEPY